MVVDKRISISKVNLGLDQVVVAGRITSVRKMKNFCFLDMSDVSGRIQIVIGTDKPISLPNLGDIVMATGKPVTTKTGQLSIACQDIDILSSSTENVSSAIKNHSDKTTGALDRRSLDLMVNNNLKRMVKARSLFIGIVRDHFREGGFLEVDTPVLSYARFAGSADVFETKSRTLKRNLYLRGTLEDYLKQLVVAGFEKVFQIGDCFRNESPALIEFTMLEATWAYAKSEDMLQFIQDLIFKICEQLPDELIDPKIKKELSSKIKVVTFWEVLKDYFKFDIRNLNEEDMRKLVKSHKYTFPQTKHYEYEIAKFGYDVIKRELSVKFESPTFVGRFPACISPLAREIQDGKREADRGYGFFKGQRLFEVVSEANNFDEQLQKFQDQDNRSHRKQPFKHDDLLASLSYGCPPMAGLGFNVNRILAVLLNVSRTSDVMAFPLTSANLPL